MIVTQIVGLEDRTLWTGATLAVLVVAGLLAWLAGPRLEERFDDETAEILQSGIVTLVGAGAAVVLVFVWDLAADVRIAFLPALDGTTAVRAMVSLLVLAAIYTLTRVTKWFVKHGYRRDAITRHQREVGHHLLQLTLLAVAVLLVLAFWGVEPSNLIIGAGALGLVLGLAARQTLSAVLAGFVLLGSRPFQVGDWVVVRDVEGVVTEVTIFNTGIRTFDGEQVTIPNDQVTSGHVVNRSTTGRLRVSVDVGVDYDADVARAVDVAEAAMGDVDEVLDSPAPDVVLDRFGDSAVVLGLRFWIADPTVQRKWAAQNAVVAAVKEALESADVDIPYPQRVLSTRDGVELPGTPADRDGESVDAPTTDDGSDAADGADGPGERPDGSQVSPARQPSTEEN